MIAGPIFCRQFCVIVCALLVFPASLRAQQDFYKDKTIRFIVGQAAGGGYDSYTRLIARHIVKHIPGNPSAVVENMTGAGSLVAANYLYNGAKPDGLTIANWNSAFVLNQALGDPNIQFDARKFGWIGSPVSEPMILYMRSDTPYKSVADLRNAKEPPKCGSTGTVSTDFILARLLEDTLPPLKINTVLGYPGGSEIDLAVEKGEVVCRGMTASPYFGREPFLSWQKKNFVRVLLYTGKKRDERIPDVPTIAEVFEKEKVPENSRRVAQVILAAEAFGRPIIGTPGIPTDRVAMLRQAFDQAMKDPELLAETQKQKMDVDPSPGAELEKLAQQILQQPPEVLARVKKILAN